MPAQEEESKRSKIDDLICHQILTPVLSIADFRTLCWLGIPPRLRPMAWKLLLEYLPRNAKIRHEIQAQRLRDYKFFCDEYFPSIIRSATKYEDIRNNLNLTEAQYKVIKQIFKDVPRMNNGKLISNDRVQKLMIRVLYLWALRHPAANYVQGMNEILVPFIAVFLQEYLVTETTFSALLIEDVMHNSVEYIDEIDQEKFFEVEVNIYGCFGRFMILVHELFVGHQDANLKEICMCERLVGQLDPELCQHLTLNGVKFHFFMVQWYSCFLVRELPLPCLVRVWDAYMSVEKEHVLDYHGCLCAVLLCHFSKELLEMGFDKILFFLKDLPTKNWKISQMDSLLAKSYCVFAKHCKGPLDDHMEAKVANRKTSKAPKKK